MRAIAFAAVLGLLAACTTGHGQIPQAPAPAPAPDYATYAVKRSVTLRSAPHLNADELARLESGMRVRARLSRAGDNWTLMRFADGREGYVFGHPFRPIY